MVAALVLSGWPGPDGFTTRIVIATAVQFGLVAGVAARLRRGAAGRDPHGRRGGQIDAKAKRISGYATGSTSVGPTETR